MYIELNPNVGWNLKVRFSQLLPTAAALQTFHTHSSWKSGVHPEQTGMGCNERKNMPN